MITIISNGSKWYGQDPDPIDSLYERLEKYTLSEFSNICFLVMENKVLFHGNFEEISAVFQIETDDPIVMEKLTVLMNQNKRRKDEQLNSAGA